MRVLVCGSRSYPEDDQMVEWVLTGLYDMEHSVNSEVVIIEGGAHGADAAARMWVAGFGEEYPQAHEHYPADWAKHGKAAGPIRNQQMLVQGQPDVVVAFVDKPLAESKGTSNMVSRARNEGVPVYVVERM